MTLKLNGSSSGSVSIDAPSSTTGGADRTLTLPDDAGNGTILTTTSPRTGNILQVIQGVYTAATNNNTASGAWWDTSSLLSATITPTATSSKILVRGMIHLGVAGVTQSIVAKLMRGGSDTAGIGDASGSRTRCTTASYIDNTYSVAPLNPEYLDSPSSISALTYSFHLKHSSGSTRQFYLNQTEDSTDGHDYERTISTITLMEVAG